LLLVSDACLQDAHGLPTLSPEPAHLGLGREGIHLKPELSFVRTRRYSPWNAHRGSYQSERQVLVAGSVITLESDSAWTAEDLQQLQAGIGIHRASGLGEVCIDSPLLQGTNPVFAPAAPVAPAAPSAAVRSPSDAASQRLLQLLQRRAGASQGRDAAEQWVHTQLFEGLLPCWQTLRNFLALDDKAAFGPGNTQWGMVADEARRASTVAELKAALLGADGMSGKVPAKDPDWAGDRALPQGVKSLRGWLAEALDDLACHTALSSEAARLDAWQRLCTQARKGQGAKGQAELKRWQTELNKAARGPGAAAKEAA
jgi:hypothetical protein